MDNGKIKDAPGVAASMKQQDKWREVGKVRQISDQVERTSISEKELKRRLPDQPGAEM